MASAYLQAPSELIQATIQLPPQKFGDSIEPVIVMNAKNSMNGTLYTYIKTSENVKIVWEFLLTEQKAIELEEFIKAYLTYNWRAIDSEDRVYIVKLTNVPIEFTTVGKSEFKRVHLEFEGVQVD